MIINYGKTLIRKFWDSIRTYSIREIDVSFYNSYQFNFGPSYRRLSFWNDYGGFSSASFSINVTNSTTHWRVNKSKPADKIQRVEIAGAWGSAVYSVSLSSPNGTLNISTLGVSPATIVWTANNPEGEDYCQIDALCSISVGSVKWNTISATVKERR